MLESLIQTCNWYLDKQEVRLYCFLLLARKFLFDLNIIFDLLSSSHVTIKTVIFVVLVTLWTELDKQNVRLYWLLPTSPKSASNLLLTHTTIVMMRLIVAIDGMMSLWPLNKQMVCLHQYGFTLAFGRVYLSFAIQHDITLFLWFPVHGHVPMTMAGLCLIDGPNLRLSMPSTNRKCVSLYSFTYSSLCLKLLLELHGGNLTWICW